MDREILERGIHFENQYFLCSCFWNAGAEIRNCQVAVSRVRLILDRLMFHPHTSAHQHKITRIPRTTSSERRCNKMKTRMLPKTFAIIKSFCVQSKISHGLKTTFFQVLVSHKKWDYRVVEGNLHISWNLGSKLSSAEHAWLTFFMEIIRTYSSHIREKSF